MKGSHARGMRNLGISFVEWRRLAKRDDTERERERGEGRAR